MRQGAGGRDKSIFTQSSFLSNKLTPRRTFLNTESQSLYPLARNLSYSLSTTPPPLVAASKYLSHPTLPTRAGSTWINVGFNPKLILSLIMLDMDLSSLIHLLFKKSVHRRGRCKILTKSSLKYEKLIFNLFFIVNYTYEKSQRRHEWVQGQRKRKGVQLGVRYGFAILEH